MRKNRAPRIEVPGDVDLLEDQERAIGPIGRYGMAGRGLSVSLVGMYWISAALQGEPPTPTNSVAPLQAVQQNPKGWLLLLTPGIALAASSLFDFVEAAARSGRRSVQIHNPHPVDALAGRELALLVIDVPEENASVSLPAHLIARAPRRRDHDRLRRCRRSRLALAGLPGFATW